MSYFSTVPSVNVNFVIYVGPYESMNIYFMSGGGSCRNVYVIVYIIYTKNYIYTHKIYL